MIRHTIENLMENVFGRSPNLRRAFGEANIPLADSVDSVTMKTIIAELPPDNVARVADQLRLRIKPIIFRDQSLGFKVKAPLRLGFLPNLYDRRRQGIYTGRGEDEIEAFREGLLKLHDQVQRETRKTALATREYLVYTPTNPDPWRVNTTSQAEAERIMQEMFPSLTIGGNNK